MPRCKMNQPERAAYLRVFCAHLLTDEDFETLTRAQFGSACLLMFHAWVKQGSLPADPRKLAALARCTIDELEDLRAAWPKLVPLEDLDDTAEPGARVTIPYLWREWQQVMGFYAAQRDRAARGAAARWQREAALPDALGHAQGHAQGHTQGHAQGDTQGMPAPMPAPMPNQDQDQDQDQEKRKEEPIGSSCAGAGLPGSAPPPSPVVLTLPCVGRGPKEWPITEAMLAEWAQAFPGVDPLGEARRMKLWLGQNPTRRKTHAGMGRFTLSWLGRAQDQARTITPSTGANHGRTSAPHIRTATDAAYIQQLEQRDAHRDPGPAAAAPDPDLQHLFS